MINLIQNMESWFSLRRFLVFYRQNPPSKPDHRHDPKTRSDRRPAPHRHKNPSYWRNRHHNYWRGLSAVKSVQPRCSSLVKTQTGQWHPVPILCQTTLITEFGFSAIQLEICLQITRLIPIILAFTLQMTQLEIIS